MELRLVVSRAEVPDSASLCVNVCVCVDECMYVAGACWASAVQRAGVQARAPPPHLLLHRDFNFNFKCNKGG
jgi:hypothetical protein